ncbi:MAG: replication factor C large subunit [archaeon]
MTWTEKYRPQNFLDIRGQEEAVEKIKSFFLNFPAKKSVILHGAPGTGKTTIAHILAKENKAEIFELNASDLRNREKLREILKPAIEQKSLFRDKKIILVDEADGISGTDFGGLGELLSLIEITTYPVVITANDIWDKKFNALRKTSEVVHLKEINYKTIREILIEILRKENKFISNDILTGISIKARGDLRAAINDIQKESSVKSDENILPDERNRETDIFNALRLIFKSKPSEETIRILDSVNMPIDEIILWVEENIPSEYSGIELAKAYDLLSRIDIFRKRIYRQQYWRFLVYENFFLSYGISSSKSPSKILGGFTSYKKPTRILKIWLNNQRTEKKKSIAQKYAHYVHIGIKRAMSEFENVKQILKNPNVQKELKLTEEEIEYLDK